MTTKHYPHKEETLHMADEPVVANNAVNVFQVIDIERESIIRAKEQIASGEFCTESEMDETVFYTCQELNKLSF